MREIVELDTAGKVVAKYSLGLAADELVTYLKPFTDNSGRNHWVGSARQGRQLFVFDDKFQKELQYPRSDQRHSGIQDVFVTDLDRDEHREAEIYVAFADPVGLHRIDLKSDRVWSCRSVPGITSVTKDRARFGRLLVCSASGSVVPIFVNGESETPIVVRQRTIHSLTASASTRRRATEYLGMTYDIQGRLIAVGLSRDLEEEWSYGLPGGAYQSQVETPVSAAMLAGAPLQWLLAGPEGSIHMIDDDGEFFDSFNPGHIVHGLAGFRDSGQSLLVVSSASGVTAYRVDRPE
jgi:hypothetical protein